MIVVQCKEPTESEWYDLKWPPTMDWQALKIFASRWSISIRLYDTKTKLVEREFHPA